MPEINMLPTRRLTAGDTFPFFSTNNGDAAKASFTALANLISSILGLDSAAQQVTQYESLNDGDTVVITEKTAPTWLLLVSAGAGYNVTITLPSAAEAADQMVVTINSDTGVTLTLASSGATVMYYSSVIGIGGSITVKYDSVLKRWYQISYSSGDLA